MPVLVLLAILAELLAPAASWAATAPTPDPLTADLEGQPIELQAVGTYHCHDFDFPRIHCFRTDQALGAAIGPMLAATATDYVLIFENTSYGGASMHVSQDYNVLALIGWNDRISSFKAQNSASGIFYTDWLYGGSQWGFCCNQNAPGLGSFNDTFSSVRRT